jgi:hypothetical protein
MVRWNPREYLVSGKLAKEPFDLAAAIAGFELMQRQKQRSHSIVFAVEIRQRYPKGISYESGCWHWRLMHTKFVSADPGATAGFIDTDRYSHLLLRPSLQFTQLAHSAANNGD